MNIINVTASKNYDVIIGENILSDIGKYTAKLGFRGKAAIISDSNVWPLYGQTVRSSLEDAGFSVCHYSFPAGEESKNGSTYLSVLNFLAENQLTRSDVLLALGGGVVGDMTGFAAATYLRGIAYIQLPTSLLAMVDSSVGGKTAIDLPAGKNLAGAFYQPALVLCDVKTLDSLPQETLRDGCAEVIKYGVLYDPSLFSHLQLNLLSFDTVYTVSRCVELKRDVVAQDEFDRGARQKLNLGHTFGHSLEKRSNYSLSHGKGVSIGLAIIARAAEQFGICDPEDCEKIVALLHEFGLPTSTDATAQEIYLGALSDKKRSGQTVHLIIPEKIGSCRIQPTHTDELISYIEAGI